MKFSVNAALKIVVFLVLNSALASCIRIESGEVIPTIGDQIIDLARAKQTGLISEEEFEKLKRQAMASF